MELKVPSDLYNAWFIYPGGSSGTMVDYFILNTVAENLPEGYLIPDAKVMSWIEG
ncbi:MULTISPECIES: hypothetical protein [Paenibacillus]|uniref:hypothetical protein n=1 Tax=Paenibacillus TaxID=44249 RepID=UPI000A6F6997|nr:MULTISPECIES: hypothetical protein [Paenibacillus]GIP24123.1 hypothetical protein J22TS3_43980 [Paenibacillus sp. J22TS3]